MSERVTSDRGFTPETRWRYGCPHGECGWVSEQIGVGGCFAVQNSAVRREFHDHWQMHHGVAPELVLLGEDDHR